MKARLLKKILNNTDYAVHHTANKICVGSPMCPELFNIDKKTMVVTYELGYPKKDRSSLLSEKKQEGLFIFDKLQELVDSGEINSIMDGNDEIENPIPVWYVKDGKLIEAYTDAPGWPNVTHDGILMYNNEFFTDKVKAIRRGVEEWYYRTLSIEKNITRRIEELQSSIAWQYSLNAEYRNICGVAKENEVEISDILAKVDSEKIYM